MNSKAYIKGFIKTAGQEQSSVPPYLGTALFGTMGLLGSLGIKKYLGYRGDMARQLLKNIRFNKHNMRLLNSQYRPLQQQIGNSYKKLNDSWQKKLIKELNRDTKKYDRIRKTLPTSALNYAQRVATPAILGIGGGALLDKSQA